MNARSTYGLRHSFIVGLLVIITNVLFSSEQIECLKATLFDQDINSVAQPMNYLGHLYQTIPRAKRDLSEVKAIDINPEQHPDLPKPVEPSEETSRSETVQSDPLAPNSIESNIDEPAFDDGKSRSTSETAEFSHIKPLRGSYDLPEVHFDARDVTYFLESHPAHSVHDPRAYFTEEKTIRSLSILLSELPRVPSKLRFAFIARAFNELGRKIASKLNLYSKEVAAIMRKMPDDLGNKPEVSMLFDIINNVFESKLDPEPDDGGYNPDRNTLADVIGGDEEKAGVYNSALNEIAHRFTDMISFFVHEATRTGIEIPHEQRIPMTSYLCDAIQQGMQTMVDELRESDKFRISQDIISSAEYTISMTCRMFKENFEEGTIDENEYTKRSFNLDPSLSFKDLNQISDRTGFVGAWNSYMFTNLGSAERVIKLLASLLSRVPSQLKSRWINMYISQFEPELERSLSGFIFMQAMPHNRNASQVYLLDSRVSPRKMPHKTQQSRADYVADKNRIPARCYLAGRRWRLILSKSLEGYSDKEEFMKQMIGRVELLKRETVNKEGNEFYRLCMPRLEVGLRGLGINGEPQSDDMNVFPLKNPIDNLNSREDPFVSGIKLGFNIGFKQAYNEERNASLEIEAGGHFDKSGESTELLDATTYLSRASIRRATTEAVKRAFPVAIREGYLSTLKLSVRAGIQIPSEAGSKLAAIKCGSYGAEAGLEAARSVSSSFFLTKSFDEENRRKLVRLSNTCGLAAGGQAGETIGAIVGKEAAEEAYKRSIIRGGKITRAKFHLDEYSAGADLGFKYGLKQGKLVATSSSLDPSAPRFFRFAKPVFSGDGQVNHEVDHWEKDLIPPLTSKILNELHEARNHTLVRGSLRGIYMMAKEMKQGFQRLSYSNITYNLEVFADGFISDKVAYLNLNGTVNKLGVLRGSLIAKDIFNDDNV